MALAINNNLMANNVTRNLQSHYGKLGQSTQRLSSGLRVSSAADDAAGLAVRELMRADIAALNQGIRNANDGISMIQTADGALGVIDSKLIRMKELAEQSATSTYTDAQRVLIDKEYQSMAKEITRIATDTDFNGMKLMNGQNGAYQTAKGELAALDPAKHLAKTTHGRTELTSVGTDDFLITNTQSNGIKEVLTYTAGAAGDKLVFTQADGKFGGAGSLVSVDESATSSGMTVGQVITTEDTGVKKLYTDAIAEGRVSYELSMDGGKTWTDADHTFVAATGKAGASVRSTIVDGNFKRVDTVTLDKDDAVTVVKVDKTNGITATVAKLAGTSKATVTTEESVSAAIHFGSSSADSDNYRANIARVDATALGIGDGATDNVRSIAGAKVALDNIDKAIVRKDTSRAELGATQNRLTATIENVSIQKENLQAAESRISDVDVATEMTEFNKQQILANAAVSMLSQANNLPKMAQKLLG